MAINATAVTLDDSWFLTKMKRVHAFSILSDRDIMKIVSEMRTYEFQKGTTLVNQGESANLFFVVQKGEVEVSVKKFPFRQKKVAVLKSGDFFGESVLVTNAKRTATVTAKTNAICSILLKPSFSSLLNTHPLFKQTINNVLSRRKQQLKKS